VSDVDLMSLVKMVYAAGTERPRYLVNPETWRKLKQYQFTRAGQIARNKRRSGR